MRESEGTEETEHAFRETLRTTHAPQLLNFRTTNVSSPSLAELLSLLNKSNTLFLPEKSRNRLLSTVKCTQNDEIKMEAAVNDSFESQTRSMVEVSVTATVTALERDGAGGTAAATLPQILQDMGRELTDKITRLHRDTTSTLLRENRALRAELKSNIGAGFQLEKQLRSQVGRLRREVAHLDQDLKRMRERSEKNRTLRGPVHVLLQSGSVLGETEGGFACVTFTTRRLSKGL